jgi:hypothetical protein
MFFGAFLAWYSLQVLQTITPFQRSYREKFSGLFLAAFSEHLA